MPRYRAKALIAHHALGLIPAGDEFDSDVVPGSSWEPLDDDAKGKVAAMQKEAEPKTKDAKVDAKT